MTGQQTEAREPATTTDEKLDLIIGLLEAETERNRRIDAALDVVEGLAAQMAGQSPMALIGAMMRS